MYKFSLLLAVLLLATACGRKEPPQVMVDTGPPEIATLNVIDANPSNKVEIELVGGEGGVGYQIDRAEMDPYCKCPSVWQRYYEEPPQVKNNTRKLKKMIRLEVGGHDYVYRFRAIDALGRLGAWSKQLKVDTKK